MMKQNRALLFMRITLFTLIFSVSLSAYTIDDTIDSLIAVMSLDEKKEQLSTDNSATVPSIMTTYPNVRLGIPGFTMNDGPHGVRPLDGVPYATAYPMPISMTAMWDRDMWYRLGDAMGTEFYAFGKDVQLGPSIDLAHNPRNGRTGETAGEDSYLSSQFAQYIIQGIQMNPVIATVKHFTGVNRQEYRHTSDITITEQQIMDQYGYHYKRAVQEGGALALMSAYNLLNGIHASESDLLLTTILKERWGYPFMVMSDWNSVHTTEDALNAGNDLCMGSFHYRDYLVSLVNGGLVSEETVNESVRRVLKTKMLAGMLDPGKPVPNSAHANTVEHQQLAREVDQKAIILLKNSDAVLPLPKGARVAVIGPNADVARFNIYGSSYVYPPYSVSPLQGIQEVVGAENVTHVPGCNLDGSDASGFSAAVTAAASHDYVLFFGGLSDAFEGEAIGDGGDRKTPDVQLPQIQKDLIAALAEANPNLVVALQSGGVLAIDGVADKMKGLLYSFYTGMEGGHAFADVIFGDFNPAGRLPVTMPISDEMMPEWNDDFTDDFFDGYRFYDETGNAYQYAFGYGLSYTTFTYSDLKITPASPRVGERITVSVMVTNSGERDGEEVAQLYLKKSASPVWHPKKELINFDRVAIVAGESKEITFIVEPEDLNYFDLGSEEYRVASGTYSFAVGGASDNLPLEEEVVLVASGAASDLRPLKLYTYPRFPIEGDNVLLMATVKNYGVKATTAEEIVVSWKVNGQVVAYSKALAPLAPGQMQMVYADTEIADSGFWQVGSGSVIVEVIVDAENVESEMYEGNNSGVFELSKPGSYTRKPFVYELPPVEESSAIEEGSSSSVDGGGSTPSESSESGELPGGESSGTEMSSSEKTSDVFYGSTGVKRVTAGIQSSMMRVYAEVPLHDTEVGLYTLFGVRVGEYAYQPESGVTADVSHIGDGPYVIVLKGSGFTQNFIVTKSR